MALAIFFYLFFLNVREVNSEDDCTIINCTYTSIFSKEKNDSYLNMNLSLGNTGRKLAHH